MHHQFWHTDYSRNDFEPQLKNFSKTDKSQKGEFKIRALIRFLSDRYSYNYLLLTGRMPKQVNRVLLIV
jgi:hypothetical protein